MELEKARHLAIELMTQHGVYPEWDFKFDRSKVRHGQARRLTVRGREVKEITLSRYITELNEESSVRDTILHEIAHVLVGLEHGHDRVWEAKALSIGSIAKQWTDHDLDVIANLAPYTYKCNATGHIVRRSHRPIGTLSMLCKSHPDSEITRYWQNGDDVLVGSRP